MSGFDAVQRWLHRTPTRREFLELLGAASGTILLGGCVARRGDPVAPLSGYPFTLGVASGDPTPDGIVLWTRLAPDPLNGGGMPPVRVPVRWELAADESFRRVVQRGDALAAPELAHSVHVEVAGLEPDRVYWYRFLYDGVSSAVGRTRTAPGRGASPDRLTFAFVSCQNYQQGYYTALRHLADEDVAFVVHLGDYIYESVLENRVRSHGDTEPLTLDEYRARYAIYKTDPDLQAAHAALPFVVTWDDHEVDNNYAGPFDQAGSPTEVFLRRRAAAYQAYYEHMPLRRSGMPAGPDLRLYRRFAYGDLLTLNVLDTRQYRSDQPCGDGLRAGCDARFDPAGTILGGVQEAWLLDGLCASRTRWNVLANQVPFVPQMRVREGVRVEDMDKWDGYAAARERVMDAIRGGCVANPVIITGDVHVSWVADLPSNLDDPTSAPLATEFVGTSLTSGGDGRDMDDNARAMLARTPHLKYFNALRGYVRCTVTPERWASDYRLLPYVSRPGAPIRTDASFVLEAGRAGVLQA